METKVCTNCKEDAPLSNYYKDAKGKNGLRSFCKKCENEKKNVYYHANKSKPEVKEKVYIRRRKWLDNNRERERENYRKLYKKNPDIRAKKRVYDRNRMANLDDWYVAKLLVLQTNNTLNIEDVPPDLIEIKRNVLKLKRKRKNN